MTDTKRAKWVGAVRFVLESFGPLIVFVVLEHRVSLLAAIVSSIVTGAVLVGLQIARERSPDPARPGRRKFGKISPFTAFVAVSVAVFGALDLKYRTGFFVKIEPALGNALTGAFFLATVALGRPVILELAEKQRSEPFTDRARVYLRALTVVWGLFFFARTAAYVWMAYHLTIDQALAIRSVASPVSFGVMIVGEMGFRWLRWGKKAFQT